MRTPKVEPWLVRQRLGGEPVGERVETHRCGRCELLDPSVVQEGALCRRCRSILIGKFRD